MSSWHAYGTPVRVYNRRVLPRREERESNKIRERILSLLGDVRATVAASLELVRKINERQESGGDKTAESTKKGANVQPTIRSVVEIPLGLIDSYKADQRQSSRHQRRQVALGTANLEVQKRLSKYTLGAFIAAGAYALIAFVQWRDLRHNSEIEQRAWMEAVVDWSNFPNANTATIQIANTGKSPAFNPHIIARMEIIPTKEKPSFVWKFRPHLDDQFSLDFPGRPEPPTTISLFDDQPKPAVRKLTAPETKMLNGGDAYMVVWGFVIYTDPFRSRWTRFCDWKTFQAQYIPDFNARPCVIWNSVGDGESPDE